jgi:spermidine/putrescine transport system permease protein
VAPEVVLGSSLAMLFLQLRFHQGMLTVIAADTMFCVSFGRDHRAGPPTDAGSVCGGGSQGPRRWTVGDVPTGQLPVIMPGVVASAPLAFALSIDDFITTEFTSGSFMTCPLWIWSVSRQGLPPQADVMGSIIFLGGALAAGGWALFQRRRA